MFSFYSSARKVGAILGPGFGLLSIFWGDHRYSSEAAATWQWNNFLEEQAAPGQVVVHINLDETCVKLCPRVPLGAVAIDGGSTKKEALEQEQKASLHARRSAMTFVCSVCDDTNVQLRRCGLFSGAIAVCAYAQMVDELRQNPFELGGRGGEETDQKRRHVNSQFLIVKPGFWSPIFGSPKRILVRQFYKIDDFVNLQTNDPKTCFPSS